MFTRVLSYSLRKLWQIVAVLLVTLAVVISLLRVTLPHAHGYKQHIVDWVATEYSANIEIGSLSAGWAKFGPAIIVKDVQFTLPEQSDVDLSIGETRVELNFWKSVAERRFQARSFVLDGVALSIKDSLLLNLQGTVPANPQPIEENEAGEKVASALADVFLKQLRKFSLVNSYIQVETSYGELPRIDIDNLEWINDADHHQGKGQIRFSQLGSTPLEATLDLYGYEREEIRGQLYIRSDKLDIDKWLSKVLPSSAPISNAVMDFQGWTQIAQGIVHDSLWQVDNVSVSGEYEGRPYQARFGQGQLHWRPFADGWKLLGNGFKTELNNLQWQDLDFAIDRDVEGLEYYVKKLEVDRLLKLVQLPWLSPEQQERALAFKAQGNIHDLIVRVEPEDLYVSADLQGVSWQFASPIPGLSIDSGKLSIHNRTGVLEIDSVLGEIDFGDRFVEPLQYDTLKGQFTVDIRDELNWSVESTDFALANSDLKLDADVKIDSVNGLPGMSLDADVSGANVMTAYRYYPLPNMPANIVDYLNNSFRSGDMPAAKIIWEGRFAGFPYRDQSGVFQAFADVKKLGLKFSPDWPQLHHADVQLQFENAGMTIVGESGNLLDTPVRNLVARIPDFGQAVLTITGDIDADVDNVKAVLAQSPLRESTANTLEFLGLSGDASGDIKIEIPLKNVNGTSVSGNVQVSNGEMYLETLGLAFSNVDAQLGFLDNLLEVKSGTASLYDKPIQFSAAGESDDIDYYTQVTIDGEWSQLQTSSLIPETLKPYLEGTASWQGIVGVRTSLQSEAYDVSLEIDADLTESRINLPYPYSKDVDESSRLLIEVEANQNQVTAKANWDEQAHFFATMRSGSESFERVHLVLGPDSMLMPARGFDVTVQLPVANFNQWHDFIDAMTRVPSSGNALIGIPNRIRGNVSNFDFDGIKMSDVDFQVGRTDSGWPVRVTSREVRGNIFIDNDWLGKGVTADLDRMEITLASEDVAQSERKKTPDEVLGQFPPINFQCRICQINDLELGSINLEISRSATGLSFDRLTLYDENSLLNAIGSWNVENGVGKHQWNASLTTDDFGDLLSQLDVSGAIRDSKTSADANLTWEGLPHEFDLASLNGTLNTHMRSGHIADISDKGTRLFSLLSLDSIVRKLTLDFRDVFAKGFFYNSIKGQMTVENGVATTQDTVVDGLAGEIELKGSTNLISHEVDYNMAFRPKVTSSIPVIVAWMVNPAAGLAALALDQAIQSAQVIAKVEFLLTGTIEDPIVNEVGRSSKQVDVPQTAQNQKFIATDRDALQAPQSLIPDKSKEIEN